MQVINISRYAGSAGVYFSVESGKVTIWARVKTASGLKSVALVPTVMSSSKAQAAVICGILKKIPQKGDQFHDAV